jgi:hypothetical protein
VAGENDPPHQGDLGIAGELPPLDFEMKVEHSHSEVKLSGDEGVELDLDLRLHLDTFRVKRQQAEIDGLSQAKVEREQLHELRKASTGKLFILTVIWLSIIWLVVFLQGFGQWFLPFPAPAADEKYLKFHLSDSVVVAFITSTTATVLGLYGIAAYWLYGKKKSEEEAKEPNTSTTNSKSSKTST